MPRVGVWGVQTPTEIPKVLQKKRAKRNPIVKTVKKVAEFMMLSHQDVRKKGSKILKLRRFAIVLMANKLVVIINSLKVLKN